MLVVIVQFTQAALLAGSYAVEPLTPPLKDRQSRLNGCGMLTQEKFFLLLGQQLGCGGSHFL